MEDLWYFRFRVFVVLNRGRQTFKHPDALDGATHGRGARRNHRARYIPRQLAALLRPVMETYEG